MTNLSKNFEISKKTILFIIFIVFFVAADRFLKALCLKGSLDRPIPLLGDVFSLHFVKNYYISFSIPFSGPFLTALIGLIIIILLIYLIKTFKNPNIPAYRTGGQYPISNIQMSLIILITGAILNFSDRLAYGYIIDYFDLKYFTVFNLADCLICAGVAWLLYVSFKKNGSAVSQQTLPYKNSTEPSSDKENPSEK